MEVLFVPVNQQPELMEIDGTLEAMQQAVGGWIEVVNLDETAVLICNEEGKLEGLPLNRPLFNSYGELVDIVAGDFFICNAPGDSDSFEDITDIQIAVYSRYFDLMEVTL